MKTILLLSIAIAFVTSTAFAGTAQISTQKWISVDEEESCLEEATESVQAIAKINLADSAAIKKAGTSAQVSEELGGRVIQHIFSPVTDNKVQNGTYTVKVLAQGDIGLLCRIMSITTDTYLQK